MNAEQQRLTRSELAGEAEEKFCSTFPELVGPGSNAITERTVRYWTQQGLLPRRGRPNRAGMYEMALLDQCVFIRRLQVENALTLEQIRYVLQNIDQDTIQRVANGVEPLQVQVVSPMRSEKISAEADERILVLPQENKEMMTCTEHPPCRVHARAYSALQRLSDSAKAKAIANGVQRVTSQECTVEIHSIDYSRRFQDREPTHSPARIECGIILNPSTMSQRDALERMREVPDVDWCAAIADELSDQSGEQCSVELLRKRYLPSSQKGILMTLTLLVAAAHDECQQRTS